MLHAISGGTLHLQGCQICAFLLHELSGHLLNAAVQLLLLQQAAGDSGFHCLQS